MTVISVSRVFRPFSDWEQKQTFLRYALGSLAECDTQLIIAESLGYGTYTKSLKARIMSLTMGIRAYAKTLGD